MLSWDTLIILKGGTAGMGISEGELLVQTGLSPSAPIDTSLTPLLQMKSSALFTLAILWKRILPLSGLGSLSPNGQKEDSNNILQTNVINTPSTVFDL